MSSDQLVDKMKTLRKITEYRVEVAPVCNGFSRLTMQGAQGTGAEVVGVCNVDRRQVVMTFHGGQFIMENKRKKKAGMKRTGGGEGVVVRKKAELGRRA